MALGIIKKKAKTAYSRIVLNRITAGFVVFSFVLCLVQGIIQSLLFTVDSEYNSLLQDIIQTVTAPSLFNNVTEIPSQIDIREISLRFCNDIPIGAKNLAQNCSIIFDTSQPDLTTFQPAIIPKQIFLPGDHVVKISNDTGVAGVQREVSERCAQTLLYAHQNLRNFSSEDLTFIFLQFWLFGISLLAVTNDSVAHLLTALMARALVTAWSIYSLWRTRNFTVIFRKLYADPGTPCNIDFFSNFFTTRLAYQIPDLVLTDIGFFITCWHSWKLLRMYNSQALRYVGAPEHINRINKLFLAVLSCLQLEAFIILTSMGLWVDVLRNTAIKHLSTHNLIYIGTFISTSLTLIPWVALGWYSIRREMKKAIILFILMAFMIIIGWSVMFYSLVYRWTFLQWPFLAGCSTCSLFLVVSTTALAIICRLNFGKGLKQYLHAEAALAESGFAPEVFRHDEEKSAPLDLGTADVKQSSFSPTSPTAKYEYPSPTYLVPSLPRDQAGSVETNAAKGRRADALEAPLRVPRLAERPTKAPAYGGSYNVKPGGAF